MRCPACGLAELLPFFEQPDVPVFCNVLWPAREAALAASRGRIELGVCETCGLIHNVAFDAGLVAYSPDYENSLHFSPRFQAFAADLARHLVETRNVRGKDVVEIGCGKGDFLAMLCEAGDNRGIGVDASFDPSVSEADLRVIREPFDDAHADLEADCLVCRHVLEHVAEPRDFVGLLHAVASKRERCIVYVEVPNALWTLRDLGIWDVIYEHCSYFCPATLERLFATSGFSVLDVRTAFDGQFLSVEAEPGAGAAALPRPGEIPALARDFGSQFTAKVSAQDRGLGSLFEAGQRVALWGAGSKGVTFLNTVARGREVEAVVDLNPRKHGRFVPGTGHVVAAPEELAANPPDTILVMNPTYEAEIARHCADMGISNVRLVIV